MRRLKRNEEGVSPVIATILMVAITVVLAATLWMMLDTDEDATRDFYGTSEIIDRSTSDGYVVAGIASMNPSSRDIEDVRLRLYDGNDVEHFDLDGDIGGNESFGSDDDDHYNIRWTRTEDTVDSTSRIHIEYDGEYDFSGYELVMTVDGYSGSLTWDL